MKKASIVIPTRNKFLHLVLTLKSLEGQIDNAAEVIVVFDGCDQEVLDNIRAVDFSYDYISVICKNNIGRAAARNKGIVRASGEIIIFLDDDRLVERDFVQKHINAHRKKNIVVLGDRYNVSLSDEKLLKIMNDNNLADELAEIKNLAVPERNVFINRILRIFSCNIFDSITFTTGNASVKREDLLKAGLFDEKYKGWGYEDVDLGYRLHKLKLKFRKVFSIKNFHILHPTSTTRKSESVKNLNYFLDKIKSDRFAYFFAKLFN
jgi:GT2 family glycosyltransferase